MTHNKYTMNLLDETAACIVESGHTPDDIVFIGSRTTGHRCTWDEFQVLANVDYNNDFGAAHVASDLVIVFSDGATMWRGEYDGSEWWEFSRPFDEPKESHPITVLVGESFLWATLGEMNEATA
jgi:hypothetical protein